MWQEMLEFYDTWDPVVHLKWNFWLPRCQFKSCSLSKEMLARVGFSHLSGQTSGISKLCWNIRIDKPRRSVWHYSSSTKSSNSRQAQFSESNPEIWHSIFAARIWSDLVYNSTSTNQLFSFLFYYCFHFSIRNLITDKDSSVFRTFSTCATNILNIYKNTRIQV